MAKITRNNRERIVLVFGIFGLVLFLLMLKTAWVQIVKADEYEQMALQQQTNDIPVEAKRGTIYDAKGRELATSTMCYSIWARPQELKKNRDIKIDELAKKLAVILDKDQGVIYKKLTSDRYLENVDKYLSSTKCDSIRKLNVSGLEISNDTRRYYPMGTAASKLIGNVNDKTKEGRSGIEKYFDGYLGGVSGRSIGEADINGNALAYGKRKFFGAKDGCNLTLTIDEVLQNYAEKAVRKGLSKTKARKVMCLAMDPKTGDILAMATNPSFNSNSPMLPANKSERSAFKKLSVDEQSKYLNEMWKNPIVSDLYEPGSTFKILTTASALEEGVTTPKTRYFCSGQINVEGTILHCWQHGGHGPETMTEALGNSCNPVMVQLAQKLGKDVYYDYLDLFGITDRTYVDLPDESLPIIKDKKDVKAVDLATMAYGHGITVTPLQLATAISSIGNDGMLMKPRIVSKMTDSKGKTVKTFKPEKVRQVISSKTAKEVCKMMEFEVSKGGGGNAKIPGYRIGGKTGTANIAVNGGYSDDTFSSFIGMAPMDNPQITVLVVVDRPRGSHYGNMVAAPIAKDFFKDAFKYMNISPDYSKIGNNSSVGGMIRVPNVTGMDSAKASEILSKTGFKTFCVGKKKGKNFKVKDQYPKPNSVAEKGENVYIYRK